MCIDSLLMCLAYHRTNDLLMTTVNFDEQVLNEFIRVSKIDFKKIIKKNILQGCCMLSVVICIVY